MLRTIRAMALIALGMQLVIGINTYSQIIAASNTYGSRPISYSFSFFTSVALPLLFVTSYLLAFALGVVTLVAAAQHRRRRWFVPLLPLTILVGYANIFSLYFLNYINYIIYTYSRPTNYLQPSEQPAIVAYIPLICLGLPVALALVALAYSGAVRQTSPATAKTGAASDAWDATDAEDALQVSSLDTPLDV